MVRRIKPEVMAMLAWLVSAAMGLVAVLQVYEASHVLALVTIPINPDDTVSSAYSIELVPRVALIFLAIGWLAGVVLLLPHYAKDANKGRRLAVSFVKTTAIELFALGLASAIIQWLPSLALHGVS